MTTTFFDYVKREKKRETKMNKVEPVVTSSLTRQKRPSLLISVRFLMAIILGFCYLINYMQRTNMSIAIVCMVNSSAVLELEGSEYLANSSGQNLNCVADETSDKYSVSVRPNK